MRNCACVSTEKMATRALKREVQADDDDATEPEVRKYHESALLNKHLYLFGGMNMNTQTRKFFPRNVIWVMNLGVEASKRKWVRRLARGTIPPPCRGAQCVVINEMIYSYGGQMIDGKLLGAVYRLDPLNMKWIEVDTYIEGTKPAPRSDCSLCVIGSRIILFGGYSVYLYEEVGSCSWNNEIYKLAMDTEGRAVCLDLKLNGTMPESLLDPAMVSIDQNRAIILGDSRRGKWQSFVLNLHTESLTTIDFDPSPRGSHALCQLVKEGLEEKSRHLLVGFLIILSSEFVDVSNIDDNKVYKMKIPTWHKWKYFLSSHCVENEEKTMDILFDYHGVKVLHLDERNASFVEIQTKLHLSLEIHILQRNFAQLVKEMKCSRRELKQKERDLASCWKRNAEVRRYVKELEDRLRQRDEKIFQLRQDCETSQSNADELASLLQQKNSDNLTISRELENSQRRLEQKTQDLASSEEKAAEAQRCIKEQEDNISVMRCDLASRQDEISALRQECETCQCKATELENDLQKKNGEILAMRQELEQKAEDLASSEEKVAEAQHCIKEQEDEISAMKCDLASRRDEVAVAQRQLGQRDDEISALRQEYETCQSKATKLENDLKQKNSENLAMRQELEQKAQDLASSEEKAAEAQHCIKEQEDKISAMKCDLASRQDEVAVAQRQLGQRNDEISALRQEYETCQSKATELESNLQLKNSENFAMRQELEQKAQDLASCEEKAAAAQLCLKKQEEKTSVMEHDLASRQNEVAVVQRQLAQRNDEISVLRQEYETCQSQATELENDLQQKNVENSAMRQELDQKAQNLASCAENAAKAQHCLKEREDEISNISQKLSTFRLELAKAQRHLHNRNEEISTLRQEISSSQDEYDANTLTMRKELDNKNEENSTLRQNLFSSQSEYDAKTLTMRQELDDAQHSLENKNEEISTLREKLERLEVERSHVSTQTERPANEDETNTLINRFFSNVKPHHILLLLSILAAICVGVYNGYPKTSSLTNSSPVSFYDAPWNDFSRIVCEAGFNSWQDIGDRLGYDWHTLQAISERGQGSKKDCRSLLAKYVEENGDSREGRSKVVDSCFAIQIGGRLKDIVKRNGYFI